MKRAVVLGLVVVTSACGGELGNPSTSQLPAQQDGKPGATVCGLPGEKGKAGFSFVDCDLFPRIDGEPFGQRVAAGSSLPIYIDSPILDVTSASSSNTNVAKVSLHRASSSSRAFLAVTALAPGATKLVLRTGRSSTGDIVDQISIGVLEPNELHLRGLPEARAFALVDTRDLNVCAQPLQNGLDLAGGNVIEATASEGLFMSLDGAACTNDDGLTSVTGGLGYRISPLVAEKQTLSISMKGIEHHYEITPVELAGLTDIEFNPPSLNVDRKLGSGFDVTLRAGDLPAVGATCRMSVPGMKHLSWLTGPNPWMLNPASAKMEEARYVILPNRLEPGTYQVTCSIDDGRLQKSITITAY